MRKNSNDRDLDLDILLKNIKVEIDSLLKEPFAANSQNAETLNKSSSLIIINNSTSGGGQPLSSSSSSTNIYDNYFNNDLKMLIETYEKCCRKLNELNEKSILKGTYQSINQTFILVSR